MDVHYGTFHFSLSWWFALVMVLLLVYLLGRFYKNSFVRSQEKSEEKEKSDPDAKHILALKIEGPLVSTSPKKMGFPLPGYPTTVRSLAKALRKAEKDDAVAGVLISLNTPGGTVPASELLRQAIQSCAEQKPVYVFADEVCASGGVLAACGATRVFVTPDCIYGSIGVRGPQLRTYTGVRADSFMFGGVEADSITARTMYVGAGKNFGDPFDTTGEGEREVRDLLDDAYVRFTRRVAESRRMTEEAVRKLGAHVYSGNRAHKHGLVDEVVERKEDVLAALVAVTNLPADYTVRKSRKKKPTLLDHVRERVGVELLARAYAQHTLKTELAQAKMLYM
jgi:signal peptide peptidase SppA